MKIKYEAWQDEKSTTFADEENITQLRGKGLFSGEPKLLHTIMADTPEEASAVHHIKMGWEPYIPQGKPENCPKCGAIYYPEGSGECPNCGKIC